LRELISRGVAIVHYSSFVAELMRAENAWTLGSRVQQPSKRSGAWRGAASWPAPLLRPPASPVGVGSHQRHKMAEHRGLCGAFWNLMNGWPNTAHRPGALPISVNVSYQHFFLKE
jgi:hypothetical protein